jgi:formate dehydrogenase major subunit
MTRRSQTDQFRPTDVLELSPADAARLDITEGDWVTLKSRYGEATLPALRAPWLKAGELFATFHDPSVFLNKITGRHRDAIVGAPEYNVTAVRLDKPGDVLHGTAIADGGPE